MEHRNKFTDIDYRTPLQWAKDKRIVNADAVGIEMWSNANHYRSFVYYTPEQVHEGTVEELESFWAHIRMEKHERAEKRAAEKRAREAEERRREREELIADTQAETVHSILTHIVERSQVTPPDNSGIIVVDTETTGLDSFHDEILQISIIDDTGKVLLDTLCRPYYHDSWKQAQSVNGIDSSMLQDAPYAHEIAPLANAIIAQADTYIGYNNDFDIGFINQWGIATDHLYQIDVMRDFTDYYKAHEDPSYNRWHKLIQCAEYFGYEWEGEAHNSLADVKATLFCHQQMLMADKAHASCQYAGNSSSYTRSRKIRECTGEYGYGESSFFENQKKLLYETKSEKSENAEECEKRICYYL